MNEEKVESRAPQPSGTRRAAARLRDLREAGLAPRPRNPLEIRAARPSSLRASINAMCWQCMGGEEGENHVKLIRNCAAPRCALFVVRPYQRVKK